VHREDLIARPSRQVTADEHIARANLAENPPQLFPPLDLLLSRALDLDPHLRIGIALLGAELGAEVSLAVETGSIFSLIVGTDADVEERSMGSGTCSHGGASDSALRSNPRSKIAITRSLSKGLPGGSLRIP